MEKRNTYAKCSKGEMLQGNHIVGYTLDLVITSLMIFIFGETGAIFLISGTLLCIFLSSFQP